MERLRIVFREQMPGLRNEEPKHFADAQPIKSQGRGFSALSCALSVNTPTPCRLR
jgi:hypothetical protein